MSALFTGPDTVLDLGTELAALERAGLAHRQAVEVQAEWALDKPAEKVAAIRRIMTTENSLTAKAHSASSAEMIVETDATYRLYLTRGTERVLRTMETETRYLVARLRAEAAARGLAV